MDVRELERFANDRKRYRNHGTRNLSMLLVKILGGDANVPMETVNENDDNDDEQSTVTEPCEVPPAQPITEPKLTEAKPTEPKPTEPIEPKPEAEADNRAEAKAEAKAETKAEAKAEAKAEPNPAYLDAEASADGMESMLDYISTADHAETNAELDDFSHDMSELVRVGSYQYEQNPCAACLKIRSDKSQNKQGEPVTFRFFELYCGACKKRQYLEWKGRKKIEAEQKKIDDSNRKVVANRTIQQMKLDDLKQLKNARDPKHNNERFKTDLKKSLTRGAPVAVNLFIK